MSDTGIEGSITSLLKDWLEFSKDVQPGCAAGMDWLDNLRSRTETILSTSQEKV